MGAVEQAPQPVKGKERLRPKAWVKEASHRFDARAARHSYHFESESPLRLRQACPCDGADCPPFRLRAKTSLEIPQPFLTGRADRNEGEATSNGPPEKCLLRGSNRRLADTSETVRSSTLFNPAANGGRLAQECAPSCGLPAEREVGQAAMRLVEECATVVRLPTVVGGNAAR